MTERQPQEILGNYKNRSEYHASADEYLESKTNAFESIEDIMLIDAKDEHGTLRATFLKDNAVREMDLAYTEPETEEINYYGDGHDIMSVSWRWRAVATEVYIQTEKVTDQVYREVARVAIREFIYGVREPISTDYTFERHPDNVMHARISRNNLGHAFDVVDRSMSPYDFDEFSNRMDVVAAMCSGIMIGDGATSGEEVR